MNLEIAYELVVEPQGLVALHFGEVRSQIPDEDGDAQAARRGEADKEQRDQFSS